MSDAKLTAEELERLLSAEFPRMFDREKGVSILKVWHRGCLVRQGFHPRALRPGGLTLLALQDTILAYLHRRVTERIPFWTMVATPVSRSDHAIAAARMTTKPARNMTMDTMRSPTGLTPTTCTDRFSST